MTNYPKPENLNGTELMAELSAVGIVVNRVRDNGDNTITIETDDDEAAAIVAAHNGTIVAPEPTIEQKLASVGLNLVDLKAALGL
jgi:hypothetical protein